MEFIIREIASGSISEKSGLKAGDRIISINGEKLIDNIVKVQESLIRKALSILKPGKTMIYSTCSILKSENEDTAASG